MQKNIKALLLMARHDPLDWLRPALEQQSVEVSTARNCAEAALALWSNRPPHLVFTEVQLADGNWADVLTLAAKASEPVNVIVMSSFVDIGFYLQVIERGAFDFIVPPLSEPELFHVLSIAAEDAVARRSPRPAARTDSPAGATSFDPIQTELLATGVED